MVETHDYVSKRHCVECARTYEKNRPARKRPARPEGTRKRNPEYLARKNSKRKAKDLSRTWESEFDFLAIDGEGGGDGPTPDYWLLAASDGRFAENLSGLSTIDCFEFLFSLGKSRLWSFSFGYDANMILADLDRENLERLADNGFCYWGNYRIEFIPRKIFRISKRQRKPFDGWETLQTVTVWDIFSFIQKSFLRWVDEWRLATPAQQEFIDRMKNKRGEFVLEDYPEIREYCLLECQLLERGVTRLLEMVKESGYHPTGWYSPGSIAAAVMKAKRVKDHYGDFPEELTRPVAVPYHPEGLKSLVDQAYYGGRFENSLSGLVRGPLYDYDINSAYPFAMADFPCLACGEWTYEESPDLSEPVALLNIEWGFKNGWKKDLDARPNWGPFPARLGIVEMLRYPLSGAGWYWSVEVIPALKLAPRIKILGGWVYRTECDHKPFAYLSEFYETRKELKASGDATEYVYKLVINSTYGKTAQREGRDKNKAPTYQNMIYAGLTTATCRGMILEAVSQNPDAVISIATDGLVSKEPLNLELSDRLGGWKLTPMDWLFLAGVGIYWYHGKDRKRKMKTRGFTGVKLDFETVYNAFMDGQGFVNVEVGARFMGFKQALRRSDGEDAWKEWIPQTSRISFGHSPRRDDYVTYDPKNVDNPMEYIRFGDTIKSKPVLRQDEDILGWYLAYAPRKGRNPIEETQQSLEGQADKESEFVSYSDDYFERGRLQEIANMTEEMELWREKQKTEFRLIIMSYGGIRFYQSGSYKSDWLDVIPVHLRRRKGLYPDQLAEHLKNYHPELRIEDEQDLYNRLSELF